MEEEVMVEDEQNEVIIYDDVGNKPSGPFPGFEDHLYEEWRDRKDLEKYEEESRASGFGPESS